jgi:hypothetical protein
MPYSVDWTREARAQLAAILIHHTAARQAITAAQARIDQLLKADPMRHGIPVAEDLFAISVPPLRTLFERSDADRFVTIVGVRWAP